MCAGPPLFWRCFRDLRTRRLIQNTPTVRIQSMAMGLVEINGLVVAHSALSAPFSGRPCAYWELDIDTMGPAGLEWTIIHRNASGHPFYVRDDSGVAIVYPQRSECKVRGIQEECAGTLPDCYAEYMKIHGLKLRHLLRLSPLQFRERILEEDQCVYVLGTAMPRDQAWAVSEDDGLEATGTHDRAPNRLRRLHEETVAVIRRGEGEPTFVISQSSERDVTLDLSLRSIGELIAGPALTIIGLGYWLYSLSSGHSAG